MRIWDNDIARDLTEIGWVDVDWIRLAQDTDQWRILENTVMNLRFLSNAENFVTVNFSRRTLLHGVSYWVSASNDIGEFNFDSRRIFIALNLYEPEIEIYLFFFSKATHLTKNTCDVTCRSHEGLLRSFVMFSNVVNV
jgi:hypothetical protein